MPMGARQCNQQIEEFRTFLQKEIENTQPIPMLGIEESIYLTDHQEGYKAAMMHALQVFDLKIPKD